MFFLIFFFIFLKKEDKGDTNLLSSFWRVVAGTLVPAECHWHCRTREIHRGYRDEEADDPAVNCDIRMIHHIQNNVPESYSSPMLSCWPEDQLRCHSFQGRLHWVILLLLPLLRPHFVNVPLYGGCCSLLQDKKRIKIKNSLNFLIFIKLFLNWQNFCAPFQSYFHFYEILRIFISFTFCLLVPLPSSREKEL